MPLDDVPDTAPRRRRASVTSSANASARPPAARDLVGGRLGVVARAPRRRPWRPAPASAARWPADAARRTGHERDALPVRSIIRGEASTASRRACDRRVARRPGRPAVFEVGDPGLAVESCGPARSGPCRDPLQHTCGRPPTQGGRRRLPAHRRRDLRDQRLDRRPRRRVFGSASTLATTGTRGSCDARARAAPARAAPRPASSARSGTAR